MRLTLWGNFADPVNTRRAQAPGRDRPARLPAALSRRVAPVRQAAVVALVAVAALFALAAPAQAQNEPVWSTTMTVGETTNGDSRGYYFYEGNGALDIRFFKAGSNDYGVLALLAGEFTPTANSDPGLAFWVSSAFSDNADYTLEFAGETLPLADGTSNANGSAVEFSPAWLATNAPSLSTAQFETTLAIGAQVQACLRTATQVCPPRTEAVWSTTMTVGETSGDTVGFRDAGDSTAGGSLDSESFTTAGSTYTVKQLDVGRYNDWLIFETNPPLSSLDSYTLEFAGETLPLSDADFSVEDWSVFSFTWLAANAPSLSATQFETTLAVGQRGGGVPAHRVAGLPGRDHHRPHLQRRDPERSGAGGQQRQHDFAGRDLRAGDDGLRGVRGQRDRNGDADGDEERQQRDGRHHERRRHDLAGRGGAGSHGRAQHADGDGDGRRTAPPCSRTRLR